MLDVVALGELLVDFSTVETDASGYPTMRANPGGAPSNFLAALNACGFRTALLGKVGDDAFGRLLVQTLKSAGVETRGVCSDASAFTTLAFVTLDANGDRTFSFARKPGADTQLSWDEVDKDLLQETRAFHFGTLSLTNEPIKTATIRAVAEAKRAHTLISFDPNLRKPLWNDLETAKEQMLWGLAQADVVKIGDEELAFLWNCGAEDGAKRLLYEYGVSLAMVTMGAKGCVLMNRNAVYRAACPAVKPIDTTGAGDIFGGSAMARLLELETAPSELGERELAYIAAYAVTAASLSTEKRGGIPSIPRKEAVLAYMEAHAK